MDLTKITTPLGLLDEATRRALVAHCERGGDIECWYSACGWEDCPEPVWLEKIVYRAKPGPTKPREFWVIWSEERGYSITSYDSKSEADEHCANAPTKVVAIHCREVL